MKNETPVGKTQSAGWEVGVRKTFSVTPAHAWQSLITQPGLGYWLGHEVGLDFTTELKKGTPFKTKEGTVGEIRSFVSGSMVRMRWHASGHKEASTLQIRVLPAGKKTTISIHHDKLENAGQRLEMKKHWMGVIGKIGHLLIVPKRD